MFNRFALLAACIVTSGFGIAQAGLIVPTYSGIYDGSSNLNSITLTLASNVAFPTAPANVTVSDIRGTAALVNTDTSSIDLLFSGSPAVPNSLVLGLNGSLTQQVLLSFDLVSSDLLFTAPFFTGDVIAAAVGTPVGVVTDPSLSAFMGVNFFDFTYQAALSNPSEGLLSYGLASITPEAEPVPEPASIHLLVIFFLGVAVFSRARMRLARS